MRKCILIIWMNVLLFAATPFLHCGGQDQENPPGDAGKEIAVEPKAEQPATPDKSDTPEPQPDLAKANTVYEPPKGTPPAKDSFELTATSSSFDVAPSADEVRICFTMDAPNKEARLISRFEPMVANNGLVKRIAVSIDKGPKKDPWDCSNDNEENLTYIYAWMPGVGPFQFPKGHGVFLKENVRLRLMLLVHNTTQQPVKAASGVKIFHQARERGDKTYALWSNTLTEFEIQPGKSLTKGSICQLKEPISMLAGIPLLGPHGTDFVAEVVRPDGTREELMYVDRWSSKEYAKMFSFPHALKKKEILAITCGWRNTSKEVVRPGWRTKDELCGLLVYTDAASVETKDLCDDTVTGPKFEPPPINYKPTKCAHKDGLTTAKDFPMVTKLGSELDVNFGFDGGDWTEANWELQGGEVTFKSALIGNLLQTEFTMVAGQVRSGPAFHIDFIIQAIVKVGDKLVTYPFPVSASGTFQKGAKAGEFSVDVKCGEFKHKQMTYKIDGDTLWIGGIVTANTQIGPLDYGLKLKFKKK